MTPSGGGGRVLYLVVCAAPPARDIGELVSAAQRDGWTVCLIATPQAATWIDANGLAAQTGHPVRIKWAAGISDTFALGLLNESLGLGLPVVVAPYAKPTLAAHPAFQRSLAFLRDCGLAVLDTDIIRPDEAATRASHAFRWHLILDALPR